MIYTEMLTESNEIRGKSLKMRNFRIQNNLSPSSDGLRRCAAAYIHQEIILRHDRTQNI